MAFPIYVVVFITRRPLGIFLSLVAVGTDAYLRHVHSPHQPVVFGGLCALILLSALASYVAE